MHNVLQYILDFHSMCTGFPLPRQSSCLSKIITINTLFELRQFKVNFYTDNLKSFTNVNRKLRYIDKIKLKQHWSMISWHHFYTSVMIILYLHGRSVSFITIDRRTKKQVVSHFLGFGFWSAVSLFWGSK